MQDDEARVKPIRVPKSKRGSVVFDCPWTGHVADDRFRLRNSTAPNVLGLRCVKCHCLIYEFMELSQVVGTDGNPLAKA